MIKRNDSSALTGLVIAAGLVILPTAIALARQEQEPTQEETQKDKVTQVAPAMPEPAKAAPVTRATESTHPPRKGKFVGTHWTPYEPPSVESFPQGSKVHIIEKGDTLWDLAGKNLDDPFLWPQIWDVNQYITDSHWIYPGDPLLIPGKPTVIGEKGPEPAVEPLEPPAPDATVAPAAERPAAEALVPTPQPALTPQVPMGPVLAPLVGESDIYCSNFIVDSFPRPELEIREREDGSRTILSTGDIVFLNRGMDSKIAPGDEFTIVVNEGMVPHPIFAEDVGESVRMLGRVRVIALQESSATAEIIESCDGIEVGMSLVPFEEIPLPLTTPASLRRYGVQMQTENAGYIVDVTPRKFNIGDGDIVNIDMGSDNGLRPGDLLVVFREWAGTVKYDSPESYIAGVQARAERERAKNSFQPGKYAQSILGQIVVLRTEKHTAMAKVVTSVRELGLGDRVAVR